MPSSWPSRDIMLSCFPFRLGAITDAGWAARGTMATVMDERVMDEAADTFDAAFAKAVDLGNRLAGKNKEADVWDVADGLLAGAVQYWLYSRQPCGDPRCE